MLTDNGNITFHGRRQSSIQIMTPAVYIDPREVAKRSPLEMVHISATVPFEYQIQEGKHHSCCRLPYFSTGCITDHRS